MNKQLAGSAVVGVAVVAIVAAQFRPDTEAPAPPSPRPVSTQQATKEIYDFPAETGSFDFEIPVPGRPVTHEADRATYRSGDLVLETDRVPITQEDALSALQAIANATHADVGYDEAAEWD